MAKKKRPSDVVGNAVHVRRLATGQIAEEPIPLKDAAARLGGLKGGKARAKALTPELCADRQRSEDGPGNGSGRFEDSVEHGRHRSLDRCGGPGS